MLSKFAETLGGKLAEQWFGLVLFPALVFWLGGVAAVLWHGDDAWWRMGLATAIPEHDDWLHWIATELGRLFVLPVAGLLPEQFAAAIVGLLVVASSAALVSRLALPILRLLEGYWPEWLQQQCVRRPRERACRMRKRFNELRQTYNNHTDAQRKEYMNLDAELLRTPGQERILPTRLGNLLRAAEDRPGTKYGLDTLVCFPRLWLVLPDGVKKDLEMARSDLDAGAVTMAWSMLFLIWTIWVWWALPLALVAMFFTYRAMLGRAEVYGDLLESAFDIYRSSLYRALRWPLPMSPKQEKEEGKRITVYLWRGTVRGALTFTNEGEKASD